MPGVQRGNRHICEFGIGWRLAQTGQTTKRLGDAQNDEKVAERATMEKIVESRESRRSSKRRCSVGKNIANHG
jgi:hypothetical protein